MGSFTCKPISIASKTTNDASFPWQVSPGAATDDAALVAAVASISTDSIVINTVPNGGSISFNVALFLDTDPGTPITNVAFLPAGFVVLTCQLKVVISNNLATTPDTDNIGFNSFEKTEISGSSGIAPFFTHLYAHPGILPGNLHILGETPIVELECTGEAGSVNTSIEFIQILGTYGIQSHNYELDPESSSEVEEGQVIHVESGGIPGATPIDFSAASIRVNGVEVELITQSSSGLSFAIPPGSGAVTVELFSTLFSGSITLGSYTVLVANGSGIYVLTPGKTDDTLYSSSRDGTTWDARIPDPFVKTGFIRG